MPPQRIDMPKPYPEVDALQSKQPTVTPALDKIPGAFPLPSPGVIPPSEPSTPNVASAQAAQSLLPPRAPTPGARSPQHTPTREKSEFLEGPIDSGPSVDPTPAVRTFTQILAKATASPSSDSKDGRKPNKLQKKRLPNSANPSAQSSTHSLTGGDAGFGGPPIPQGPPSPLQPPQPPFAHGQSQASSSKEGLHSYNTDTVSSRNSGTTLMPSMSPSASFRSHSTATEHSEAEAAEEQPKEEKRSFWKGHKRGESRATPTASQTDLHGSVPGADKSMSSFASSSGWTGGGRRSLQYDTQQSSDTSMLYGSPPDHEKPEKQGAFGWFNKLRQDHKERGDRRERAKSPPGSFSNPPPPQALMQPPETVAIRGRSIDVPRPVDDSHKVDKSSDVTPTGANPEPAVVPAALNANQPVVSALSNPTQPTSLLASNSYLPAALTEPKSVARSPERSSVSQSTDTAPLVKPAVEGSTSQSANTGSAAQPVKTAPAPQPVQPGFTPSASHHASSNSTVTITPSQLQEPVTASDPASDASAPLDAPSKPSA
ncbi:hypothetical protein BKA66DRAFT_151735 [Pyrenochaeta sp. MPI-SDFR-AT-0127]|nr:hypothetical protein BKA66DRAFT_151735 [Pyrenochaeta sp. MPI-SDFR-AT-0127]